MSRQHFNISKGLTITPVAARPSDPQDGDIIYNSTNLQFEKYQNGVWVGDAAVNLRQQATNAQTVAASTTTTLQFPTQLYNTNSGTFTSNTTYTVPVTGKYTIHARVAISQPGGGAGNALEIYVNGAPASTIVYARSYVADTYDFVITDTLSLTATNTVTIVYSNGFGSAQTVSNSSGRNVLTIVKVD